MSETDDTDIYDEDGNRRPFQAKVLKTNNEPIVMNIRVNESNWHFLCFLIVMFFLFQNAVAIAPKSSEHKTEILAKLSRHQNRRNEGEWMAVDSRKPAKRKFLNFGSLKTALFIEPVEYSDRKIHV